MMDSKVYNDVGIKSLNLDADDEEGYPMLSQHLPSTAGHFTPNVRTENSKMSRNYCQAGINRSGVIAAAIYMLEEQMHVLDVVKHIRRRRGNCYLWNVSFQKQLIALAKKNSLLGPKPEDIPNLSYNEFENYLDQSGKNKFSSEKIKKSILTQKYIYIIYLYIFMYILFTRIFILFLYFLYAKKIFHVSFLRKSNGKRNKNRKYLLFF